MVSAATTKNIPVTSAMAHSPSNCVAVCLTCRFSATRVTSEEKTRTGCPALPAGNGPELRWSDCGKSLQSGLCVERRFSTGNADVLDYIPQLIGDPYRNPDDRKPRANCVSKSTNAMITSSRNWLKECASHVRNRYLQKEHGITVLPTGRYEILEKARCARRTMRYERRLYELIFEAIHEELSVRQQIEIINK